MQGKRSPLPAAWRRALHCGRGCPPCPAPSCVPLSFFPAQVCKYIDIPLQHISNLTLLGMNRPPQAHTVALLHKLRERIPGLALRTTFISGFPGGWVPCAFFLGGQPEQRAFVTWLGRKPCLPGWRPCLHRGEPHPRMPPTNARATPAGESEADHRELVDFCSSFRFERMGCFQYSEEDGTPAAELPDQVGGWCGACVRGDWAWCL